MERYDSCISFKPCPARKGWSQHLCLPWAAITRACHAVASSNSRVSISFTYFQSDGNFNSPLLKDLGRRSHNGSPWAASSPHMCFVWAPGFKKKIKWTHSQPLKIRKFNIKVWTSSFSWKKDWPAWALTTGRAEWRLPFFDGASALLLAPDPVLSSVISSNFSHFHHLLGCWRRNTIQ